MKTGSPYPRIARSDQGLRNNRTGPWIGKMSPSSTWFDLLFEPRKSRGGEHELPEVISGIRTTFDPTKLNEWEIISIPEKRDHREVSTKVIRVSENRYPLSPDTEQPFKRPWVYCRNAGRSSILIVSSVAHLWI